MLRYISRFHLLKDPFLSAKYRCCSNKLAQTSLETSSISLGTLSPYSDSPPQSSGGPRLAINCFHTYPPPYIFFHLPSSTLICFHHFSTFLSVHLIRFFIIIFPKFSPSFSPFSSPHSFHHIPLKMSFPQSPHLIHFKKINFAKYIAKNICHQKNIRTV